MRIRRRLPVIAAVLLAAAAITLAVQLRKHAPPEAARLLPSADGFVYANFSWMRRANLAGQMPDVPHDPEYEQFIQATGFQFERDLEEAAFAIHYPSPVAGARQGTSAEPRSSEVRFSEVMIGKIDGERLNAYLRKISSSVESYNSADIYSIPLEGRTLRVAILGVDTVAASNHPDPQVIRGIIDRSRKRASPFGGPSLLRQFYRHVSLTSLAWGIFRADPAPNPATPPSFIDWSFLFSKPAVVVASVRYLGSVHLRAEAFTSSDDEAQHVVDQLTTFLNIFRSAETSVSAQGPDPDVKAFFDSLHIDRHGQRGVLTASVPPGLIRKAVAEVPGENPPAARDTHASAR